MLENTNIPVQENAILQAAKGYIVERFNEKHDPRLVYHNFHHTAETIKQVQAYGAAEDAPTETLEIAQLAVWFRNMGYLENYTQPIDASVELLTPFLEKHNYPLPQHDRVVQCLMALGQGQKPVLLEQKLVADAISAVDLAHFVQDKAALLRLEEELISKRQYGNAEWAQFQLQHLMQTKFYLPASKQASQPIVAAQILAQKQVVEKASHPRYTEVTELGKFKKFQAIERKMPNSATQTFFRTNYRNHINLSAIADNKANIMISVNAIIISVLISILSYGNIMETRPMILMPVVIFLISGLTSLIFAVLSARPKVTNVNTASSGVDAAKRNIVFFGNFVHLQLEEYEEAMDAMFRNSELIYGNMTRDLYYLGKVLDTKYRYLSISYTVFMIGFIATVLTFLAAILL